MAESRERESVGRQAQQRTGRQSEESRKSGDQGGLGADWSAGSGRGIHLTSV